MKSKKRADKTNPNKLNQAVDANQEMDRRFYEEGETPVLYFIVDRGIPPISSEEWNRKEGAMTSGSSTNVGKNRIVKITGSPFLLWDIYHGSNGISSYYYPFNFAFCWIIYLAVYPLLRLWMQYVLDQLIGTDFSMGFMHSKKKVGTVS